MDIKESSARKLFDRLLKEIINAGDEAEQKSKLYWLLEDKYGINKTAIVADKDLHLDDDQWKRLKNDIDRLKRGHPVQHISGKSEFCGYEFLVNQNVLIPRPETEELVQLIIRENEIHEPRILDVGTGSGCIPITLNLKLPGAKVWAVDISKEALSVARENNDRLGSNVQFIEHDILEASDGLPEIDILVCNPPYVPESEKENMQSEVLNFEPHLALFAPADDPLFFYRRVAEVGKEKVSTGGKIYFEIHENYGRETAELLKNLGYQNIRVIKDFHSKDRIVTGDL